jgi:hypothetical protein
VKGGREALLGEWPDPLDRADCDAFDARYRPAHLGPVAVVVPAYREASTIAAVVRGVPANIGGLAAWTLVVIDGDVDQTAEEAAAAGAYVCATATNRGQGAALRLGYHVAVDCGATYLVTLDGDGQYDAADIGPILDPVVTGQADFVSGSRRLGHNGVGDLVRSSGVVCFAIALRVLTGRRVTDPAFGLRAMRADVAVSVPLRQPQYQATELLVGAIMRQFRTAERPATIRARRAGRSHKGSNLHYGWQFGRSMLSTWRRERLLKTEAVTSGLGRSTGHPGGPG